MFLSLAVLISSLLKRRIRTESKTFGCKYYFFCWSHGLAAFMSLIKTALVWEVSGWVIGGGLKKMALLLFSGKFGHRLNHPLLFSLSSSLP